LRESAILKKSFCAFFGRFRAIGRLALREFVRMRARAGDGLARRAAPFELEATPTECERQPAQQGATRRNNIFSRGAIGIVNPRVHLGLCDMTLTARSKLLRADNMPRARAAEA
jgi:hypothetical protein